MEWLGVLFIPKKNDDFDKRTNNNNNTSSCLLNTIYWLHQTFYLFACQFECRQSIPEKLK